MTINFEGIPVLIKCFSRIDDMLLYTRTDTKAKNGYIYNIYSHQLGWGSYQSGTIKFHKKLKIYECKSHGSYVICQGKRMYVNSIVQGG